MNYTGEIFINKNNKILHKLSYKYNADMYLNQIIEFFKNNDSEKLNNLFNNLKPITIKQYEKYVRLAGLHDDYNFDDNIWKNKDGCKKFNMIYQELDDRCFINLFTGKNDFEIMMETNRYYIPNNTFINSPDFKYIINLDEYKLGVNSLYYGSKVIDI